jgi:hypothetical protein
MSHTFASGATGLRRILFVPVPLPRLSRSWPSLSILVTFSRDDKKKGAFWMGCIHEGERRLTATSFPPSPVNTRSNHLLFLCAQM